MKQVTIRELRNQGGSVLDRVRRGATLTVTRDGEAIAQLSPMARQPLSAASLLRRWRRLPAVDASALRADIDRLIDPKL